jgi:hypothetical protein
VKRTCPAKTRIETDIIEKIFSRRFIHGFGFQNDLKIWSSNEVRHKQFFCQITKCSFTFCHLTSFDEATKETNFSVKSSWEVNWIVMFQKDAVCIPVYSLWNRGLLKVLINTKIFLNERNLFDHCNAPQLIKNLFNPTTE